MIYYTAKKRHLLNLSVFTSKLSQVPIMFSTKNTQALRRTHTPTLTNEVIKTREKEKTMTLATKAPFPHDCEITMITSGGVSGYVSTVVK